MLLMNRSSLVSLNDIPISSTVESCSETTLLESFSLFVHEAIEGCFLNLKSMTIYVLVFFLFGKEEEYISWSNFHSSRFSKSPFRDKIRLAVVWHFDREVVLKFSVKSWGSVTWNKTQIPSTKLTSKCDHSTNSFFLFTIAIPFPLWIISNWELLWGW